jgi:hypothetical protein
MSLRGALLGFALVVGLAIALTGGGLQSVAATSRCGASKPPISQRTLAENRRPLDFYELCINNDQPVCSDLARRLNLFGRPWTVRDEINSYYLGFDVSVQGWRGAYGAREEVPAHLPKGSGWVRTLTPRLTVDLNGDGQEEVLYRMTSSLGGIVSVAIVWSEWPPGDDHFEQGVQLLTDPRPDPNNPSRTIGAIWPDNLREYWGPGYEHTSDITLSVGRHYLVVAPHWTTPAVPRVLIVSMQDARTGRLVCLFEGRYRVVRAR